jgi:hypothetical protein
MIRKLFAVSLVALATVPATAVAGTSSRDLHASASKQCTAVQAKIGAISFERAFSSFGACVSALTPLAQQNANTAAASCRSARANASFDATHGGKTFAQFYGVGINHANAYGKCVSAKEAAASAAAVSAASACQTDLGATAFATCVTLKVHPTLTVTPEQPALSSQQPEPKGSTIVGGCGPENSAGPAHPLVASCTVAKST